MNDPIHPNYYDKAGESSPIHLIRKYDLNFPLGNAIKYIARHREKGGREDLRKALFYLLWELKFSIEEIKEITDKAKERDANSNN